jgi:hypothetical protein
MIVMLHRKFSILFFFFCFIIFRSIISRKDNVIIQSYDGLAAERLNNTDLYNAMIHPFTRIVIYGAIWYQGKLRTVRYV